MENIGNSIQKKNLISYLHVGIMLLIIFGVGCLKPFGQITPVGMDVLGVFFGVLYGWIFIDILWPGIFGMVVLGLTDYTTIQNAFSSGIGNPMVIMVIVTVVFAGALDECKITDWIAAWFLTRKCVRGRPWVLFMMIILAGAAIGMFASGLAGTFILWAMVLKIADMCGYKKGDRLITLLIGVIVIVTTCGSNCIPFQPGAILFSSFFTQATGETIPFGSFIVFNIVIQTIVFSLLLLAGKYILKLDASKFILPDEFYEELKSRKTTHDQKIGLIAVTAFFIMLFLPGILPANWPGMALLGKLGIIGVSSILLIILTIIRKQDGEPFLNITFCHKNIPWALIWLLAATFPISDGMKAPENGIMSTVMSAIAPLLTDMSPIIFMVISMIVLGILTQLAHNIILGAMFIPFLIPVCISLGGNPYTFFLMLYISLQAAYATPAASAGGAMFHGHSWVEKKDAYLIGTLFLIISLLVLTVIGVPLGEMLF